MRSDHIKLVDYLDNYDIKVGDTVYILVWPNSSCSQYNYKKAELVFIKKDTFEGEKPKEGSKHYKAKIKMWERRYNKDECTVGGITHIQSHRILKLEKKMKKYHWKYVITLIE